VAEGDSDVLQPHTVLCEDEGAEETTTSMMELMAWIIPFSMVGLSATP
jgi:hypothetical protein